MKMHQSIVILGRQPALGLAELESLYGAGHVQSVAEHAATLDLTPGDINFLRLGGSTRLARVLAELPSADWKAVERLLAMHVKSSPLSVGGKLQLGLSAYGFPISPAKLNAAALTLKKIIRGTGQSVRIIPNQELELNTAQVLHNRLNGPQGVELLLIKTNRGTTLLAQTILVQDIELYTLRDRGRPKRDARVGMLPPKLAQIIINLSEAQSLGQLWDPFCGTGVVLQEASLMEINTYGSDIEPRMIAYTKANLEWLDKQFRVPNGSLDYEYHLQQGDATTITLDVKHTTPVRHVASETYLGRPFTSHPAPEVLAQTATEVNLILRKTLQNLAAQLPAGARLCLAVPAWQISPGKFKHLPLIDHLDELGYNRVRFEHVRDDQLVYYREDQIVARELLVLTRK